MGSVSPDYSTNLFWHYIVNGIVAGIFQPFLGPIIGPIPNAKLAYIFLKYEQNLPI
jgi:hypothetical protein